MCEREERDRLLSFVRVFLSLAFSFYSNDVCVCVTMYLLFCSETSESEDEDAEQLTTGLDLEITRTINRIR